MSCCVPRKSRDPGPEIAAAHPTNDDDDSGDFVTAAEISDEDEQGENYSTQKQDEPPPLPPSRLIHARLVDCRRQQEAQFPELGGTSSMAAAWSLQLKQRDPPLRVYSMTVPANEDGGGMSRWKAVAELPCTLPEIERYLYRDETRLKWDRSVQKLEVLHAFPHSPLQIKRFQTHAQGPISSRDFVMAFYDWKETLPDGRQAMGSAGFSIEPENWPRLFPGPTLALAPALTRR